jgi:hypothetical protein
MLPFAELSPSLLEKLAARRIELLLAVRPWQLPEIASVAERVRAAGVYLGLWPMLGDEHGRWASVRSMVGFIALVDSTLERVPSIDELIIDLEPPHEVLAQWKALRPAFPTARGYQEARDALAAAILRWKYPRCSPARTLRVTTAVLPLLPFELRGEWIQRALGTPATALPVDAHNVMAYSSLFEGWSRGLVNRTRAERLLSITARAARWRLGPMAAISLGCTGPGAFGDEPAYRGIDELARDVAIVKRAGIDELALFDLAGVVRRRNIEAWLDALCA